MLPKSIGVALLTLNAEPHLSKLLPPLLQSPLNPKILLVDSASQDQTVRIAQEKGLAILPIERSAFNHGLTRELARKTLNTDIVVFLTQDAYLSDQEALGKLVEPLLNQAASLSYARQVPRPNAGLFEAFAREFNYPATSHVRSLQDVTQWGIYTFFNSNSAAAYDNRALEEIGGFQEVLLGEDTLACARLLHAGHKVAYSAACHVEHSHDYTLWEEFKRHFDTGLSRALLRPLLAPAGSDSCRGKQYALTLFKRTLSTQPWLFPYALLHIAAKWLGYRLGQKGDKWPMAWKRALSSQPYYFK